MKAFYKIILTLFLSFSSYQCLADNKDRVIAVVNNDIITNTDLEKRVKLTITLSGMQDSLDTRKALTPQILQALIDEKLLEKEAAKYKIIADTVIIKNALDKIAAQNNMNGATQMLNYIKSKGANPEEFKAQLKYQILQSKLIESIIEPKTNISDLEIKESEEQINREMKSTHSEVRYHLAEIVLFSDEPNVSNLIIELQTQLSLGANFNQLAKDFSKSTSSTKGGDVGWLMKSQLPKEISSVVAQTPVGSVTSPIKSENGYFIIKVLDKKTTEAKSAPNIALNEMKNILWHKKVMMQFKDLMHRIRLQSFVEIK